MNKNIAFAFLLTSFISILTGNLCAQASSNASAAKQSVSKSAKKGESVVVFNEDFATGAEFFQLNKPLEAIPYFEKCVDLPGVDPNVFIFLGVAYYQTEDYKNSLLTLEKGLAKPNTDHVILAYNAGNSAYAMGAYPRANTCYSLALKENPDFSPAVLNQANAQLKLDRLEESRTSYIKFLELEPENEQAPRIQELIKLLDAEIDRRARQKPELINPDDFVANQKNEVPEILEEKVTYENPAAASERKEDSPVQSEILPAAITEAPVLPEEQKTTESTSLPVENVSGELSAPPEYHPESEIKKNKNSREQKVNDELLKIDMPKEKKTENLERVKDSDLPPVRPNVQSNSRLPEAKDEVK